jgi:hypothetical protein
MRCELCSRKLGAREIAHGIRFGKVCPDSDLFIPARDSAFSVMCQSCGETVLMQIYGRFNKPVFTQKYEFEQRRPSCLSHIPEH